MIPLAAAMSRRLTARRTSSSLVSVPIEAVAVLTRVFSSLLVALLRAARLALVRLRFFWLLMLATVVLTFVDETAAAGYPLAPRAPPVASRGRPHGTRPDPQLLDHRPHRSRQVDPLGPDPRDHGRRRRPRDAGAVPRLDGARARTGHHDQGAERPRRVARPRLPP